jgi:hypothetical protein
MILIAVVGTMLVSGCVGGAFVMLWMGATVKPGGVPITTPAPAPGVPAADPPPTGGTKPTAGPAATPEDVLPQSLNYTFKGGNAAYWGKRLYEQDPWQIVETEVGMFNMKEEGLQFVYTALGSKDAGVRTLAANSLHPDAKAYPQLFVPKLRTMLSNGNDQEKVAAGLAASRANYRELAPVLREAAKGVAAASARTLNAYADGLSK